jgi:hypothetical protein
MCKTDFIKNMCEVCVVCTRTMAAVQKCVRRILNRQNVINSSFLTGEHSASKDV